MKKNWMSALIAPLAPLLLVFIFESGTAVQVIDEVQTFLEAVASHGTTDPNNSFVWLIDLFTKDSTDLPLNHWEIKAGSGSLQQVEIPPGSRFSCMRTTTSESLNFRVQFPMDTDPPINSRKNHIVFNFKSPSAFALEVRIQTKTPGDTLKDKIIRYLPENGSNYLITDSLVDTLVVRIGLAYRDTNFQTLNHNMETDLRSFSQFQFYKFQALNYVYVRGQVDVCGIASWNRYFWVEGYADSTSIAQGRPIGFKVSLGDSVGDTAVSSNKNYSIEIYRAGAVGIGGLQFIASSGTLTGARRPMRSVKADSVFRLGTDWPPAYTFTATSSWKSGVYLAKFIHTATGQYTWYPFVVRSATPGSTSKILVQISNTTYQAHNFWGGESFYAPSGKGGEKSFDRPYLSLWGNPEHRNINASAEVPGLDGLGASHFFAWEFSFVKWLEGEGYVAEYTDNVHIHQDFVSNPPENFLKSYNSFFSLGHDEYWSQEMRQNVESEFRNKSKPKDPNISVRVTHNIAFLSGNSIFWKINFPTSDLRRISTDRSRQSSWHDLARRPDDTTHTWFEQELIGARTSKGFDAIGKADTVRAVGASHWTFRGSGLAAADSFGWKNSSHPYGISGYETHVIAKNGEGCVPFGVQEDPPDGLTIDDIKLLGGADLSSGGCKSQVTYYEYILNGKLSKVFNGGAIQWTWGLDNTADPIRKVTKNVVDGLSSTFVGRISQNMTWSGQIYLGGDVTIDSGVTVTVNPGTKIYFFPNNDVERTGGDTTKTRLIIKGTFNCSGTLTDSIIFTSASTSPANGDWGGIFFETSGGGNLEFVRSSYADTAIRAKSGTPNVVVRNSTFNKFKSIAVYSQRASVNLGKTTISPPDCGKNNILMKSATSGAKAVTNAASSGTLFASGNWWDSTSFPSYWFSGNVNKDWVFAGPATPDSCPDNGGYGPSQGGGEPKVAAVPLKFELGQNYPNPFNPSTTIRYSIPKAAKVELKIYNILGQVVKTLIDEEQGAGIYQVVWNGTDEAGRNVSTGIYLYQIRAGDFVKKMKMTLIK